MMTPENTILSRLLWYRHTGTTADDQWNDILGILKIQMLTLNFRYLTQTATTLRVVELLEQAYVDAGVDKAS